MLGTVKHCVYSKVAKQLECDDQSSKVSVPFVLASQICHPNFCQLQNNYHIKNTETLRDHRI